MGQRSSPVYFDLQVLKNGPCVKTTPSAYTHELMIKQWWKNWFVGVVWCVWDVFGVKLFPVYPSPNIKLLTRRVNLPSNHGNNILYITHNHATMDILLWDVYKGIHYHYNQNEVSIGLFYSIFPLIAIMFCHVSPNPMAVPKLFLQDLKKRTQTIFRKKWRKIKIFVFEIAKVKVQ